MKKIIIYGLFAALLFCACKSQNVSQSTAASNQAASSAPLYTIPSDIDIKPDEAEVLPVPTASLVPTQSPCPSPEVKKTSDANTAVPSQKMNSSKTGLKGKIIVIDAGHGINNSRKKERVAPDSEQTKAAFVSGTSGKNQTEEELNLAVALKLQEKLTDMGAEVHMTRTEHTTDKSNIDRAVFANELNADISLRIHADGIENSSVRGVSVLVPGAEHISDKSVVESSRRAGECVLDEFVRSTGAKNRGISVRNDMTGFNWSEVPIVLVELGFMTNPDEDRLMETAEYQDKMTDGIINGLKKYFS